ncbi:MAG: metal ABC transporter solute-binding protein, Zn/Mn family [Candidatus Dormibacteraceae bacterium]
MGRHVVGALVAVAMFGSACGITGTGSSGLITVVAAEGFWGSIARQLGGDQVRVQSVVTDPNGDPHEYESSANDARAFADANLVVLNGAGYDDWGQKLLDANPSPNRVVLNVAAELGKKVGDNPHFWFNPDFVAVVADRITSDYKAIDSADAAHFDQRRSAFATALQPYLAEIANIKQRFGGTPVGATESIFVYMASALGLNLTTPVAFMDAVGEGNDPPAASVVAFQNQISFNQIKILVYNVQTVTAVTTNIKALAAARHIPSVGVSETIQPEGLSFQDWQLEQLKDIGGALSSAS